ncbi:MAG: PD40 domain-containing protein [Bacteroidales bacterium]|nr:PD40 domain-containing protein [Bacteroidales bacterium]
MKNLITIICVLLLTGFWLSLRGQKSEEELISEANSRYSAGEYGEAMSLYSRLLSVYPENPVYSFRYGVSSLYTHRNDLPGSLRYIEFAAEKGIEDNMVSYYLGLARYYNMKFPEAIGAFRQYLATGNPGSNKAEETNNYIRLCENGQSLLKTNRIAGIAEIKNSDRTNFFRAYPAEKLAGKLLLKPDIFQSAEDLKREESGLIYMPAGSQTLYFASYGNNPSNSKDIYVSRMQPNGDWGPHELLPASINTPLDEDYPVISQDGNILYFASRGHNSMGGFDIFATTFDPAINAWGPPINLDYEVNTPFNDFLLVPEKNGEYVWFASDRNSAGADLKVCKANFLQSLPPGEHLSQSENSPADAHPDTLAVSEVISGEKTAVLGNDLSKIDDAPKDFRDDSVLADSAFYLVNLEKEKLKKIKAAKEKAFLISGEKKNKAMKAKSEMGQIPANDPAVAGRYNELAHSSARWDMMSAHATNIGNVIKAQINLKETQIENWKGQASHIQETSATGTYDQTSIYFGYLKYSMAEADTFRNYLPVLDSIGKELRDYPVDIALSSTNDIPVEKDAEKQPPEKSGEEIKAVVPVIPAEKPAEKPPDNMKLNILRAEVDSTGTMLNGKREMLQMTGNMAAAESMKYSRLYLQALSDPQIAVNMADSAFRQSLKDTLSFLARSSAISYLIYREADSLRTDINAVIAMKDHADQAIQNGKADDAASAMEILRKNMEGFDIKYDPVRRVGEKLPKPRETNVGQSQKYLEVAARYLTEFDALEKESEALKIKASKKKDGKKKKELQREAEKIEKRADLKYENYTNNKEKGDDLLAAYEAAVQNKQVFLMLEDHYKSSDQSQDYPLASKNPEDFRLPLEFIHGGFMNYPCHDIITGDISEACISKGEIKGESIAEAGNEILAATPRTYVFNPHGFKTKSALLTSLSDYIHTEKNLIDKKSDLDQAQEYPAKRLQFISYLDNYIQDNIRQNQTLRDESGSGDGYLIEAGGAGLTAESWVTFLRTQGMERSLDTNRSFLVEYQDAKSIVNLTSFLRQYIMIEQLETGLEKSEDIKLANSYIDEAEFLINKALENRKKAEKEPALTNAKYLLDDIHTFEQAALEQLGTAFSVYKSIHPQSETILASLNQNILTTDLLGLSHRPSLTQEEIEVADHETEAEEETGTVAVIYRVQLAALGKALDDSHFKGIKPIVREPAGNTEITRYLGGEFHSAASAEEAKKEYSTLGFKEAFVVAYLEGKRISLDEALALKPVKPHKETGEIPAIEEKKTPPPVAVERKNVFFSIQIGVFSKPQSAEWLTEREKLSGETVRFITNDKGIHIYMAGSFDHPDKAAAKKDMMKQQTLFQDVFVIAVSRGKKIPVAEALNLLKN